MSSPESVAMGFNPLTMTVLFATEGRRALSHLSKITSEDIGRIERETEDLYGRIIRGAEDVWGDEVRDIKSYLFHEYRQLTTEAGGVYTIALDAVAVDAYASDPAKGPEPIDPFDETLLTCGCELAGTPEGFLYLMVGRSLKVTTEIKLRPENVTMMKIFAGKFGESYRPTDGMLRAIQILRGIFPRAYAYAQNLERETSFSDRMTMSGFLALERSGRDLISEPC